MPRSWRGAARLHSCDATCLRERPIVGASSSALVRLQSVLEGDPSHGSRRQTAGRRRIGNGFRRAGIARLDSRSMNAST